MCDIEEELATMTFGRWVPLLVFAAGSTGVDMSGTSWKAYYKASQIELTSGLSSMCMDTSEWPLNSIPLAPVRKGCPSCKSNGTNFSAYYLSTSL